MVVQLQQKPQVHHILIMLNEQEGPMVTVYPEAIHIDTDSIQAAARILTEYCSGAYKGPIRDKTKNH